MKFGKRLGAEAGRCPWFSFYFDYKAVKKSISADVAAKDPSGRRFDDVVTVELQKISAFYLQKEGEMERVFQAKTAAEWTPTQLGEFSAELRALKKFVALNYIAVHKAVKKRNRRLGEALGSAAVQPRQAAQLLGDQPFFTSARLATLATHIEVLQAQMQASEAGSHNDSAAAAAARLEDYSCAICLGVLTSPVVLTCAHRFCWGCMVAHCATAVHPPAPDHTSEGDKPSGSPQQLAGQPEASAPRKSHTLGDQLLNYAVAEFETRRAYDCPVCRRTQFLDLNALQVDPTLESFVSQLKIADPVGEEGAQQPALSSSINAPVERPSLNADAAPFVPGASIVAPKESDLPVWRAEHGPIVRIPSEPILGSSSPICNGGDALLPPLLLEPGVKPKLTVVLDLDGTLLSSYAPKRHPAIPRGLRTFVTGRGSKLNPGGVLAVERPGMREFLREVASFAEVVLFTAGLPDYAQPIIERLDPNGDIFSACLFRDATVHSEAYSCVKDLSRLGRDLRRTVLVDDTPLAYLHQPDNGIPILPFRSDPDDRFLLEAVLPLLRSLEGKPDVRPSMAKRFGMQAWFAAKGLAPGTNETESAASKRQPGAVPVCGERSARSKTLLLMDFDKTVTVADAGESVIGELAPELLPMLDGLEMPASFVAVTNEILSEMQRRGVTRDALVASLRELGDYLIPDESRRAIKMAARRGADVRILSDCNTVFISHMLTGAKIRSAVREIITNPAAFERLVSPVGSSEGGPDDTAAAVAASGAVKLGGHRLVIQPRHDRNAASAHACPLCPHNLCKGQELDQLRKELGYERVVYCGDGANDICPTMRLGANDVVCARRGHSLEYLIRDRIDDIKATVVFWEDHQELLSALNRLIRREGC